jgi:DNA-binding CsgD family transcriptional regulator
MITRKSTHVSTREVNADLVAVIEAAYCVERDETSWIAGMVDAIAPSFPQALGAAGYAYDITNEGRVRARSFVARSTRVEPGEVMEWLQRVPPPYVEAVWAKLACAYASEAPGFDDLEIVRDFMRPRGIADVFGVNGASPTGQGCVICVELAEAGVCSPAARATWTRIARHIAAGHRLRRRLDGHKHEDADAILDARGRLAHAEREAQSAAARTALEAAVVRMDRARGALRWTAPSAAVEEWRGLVAARWSLVDAFDAGGERYVVARRNDPNLPGPEVLSPRERQVLAYAAMGNANKMIAYTMGISVSTVGVLLSRCVRKLRVTSRNEAIARWRQRNEEDEPSET